MTSEQHIVPGDYVKFSNDCFIWHRPASNGPMRVVGRFIKGKTALVIAVEFEIGANVHDKFAYVLSEGVKFGWTYVINVDKVT